MSPYELEEAIRKADEAVSNSNFLDKTVITETFLLVRRLAKHAADVEGERRSSQAPNGQLGGE